MLYFNVFHYALFCSIIFCYVLVYSVSKPSLSLSELLKWRSQSFMAWSASKEQKRRLRAKRKSAYIYIHIHIYIYI